MGRLRAWLGGGGDFQSGRRRRTAAGWLPLITVFAWTLASAVAAGANGGAPVAKSFHWGSFLAPFHAVVLHFPIGFFTVAVILELYGTRRRLEGVKQVTRLVVWLSFFAGLVAAALGILRARGEGYDHKALEMHRWAGLSIPLLTLATLALQRRAYRPEANRGVKAGYHLLLLSTFAQLVMAGHFGGNLTHGSRYLTENAPRFMRDLLEPAPAAGSAPPALAGESEPDGSRAAGIARLLAINCGQCHGPEKQKGGYRVDHARQPGKSGKLPVVPGNPFASELARLILLPPDHDEVMPPAGKAPLTAEEIVSVIHWIQAGAVEANQPTEPGAQAK